MIVNLDSLFFSVILLSCDRFDNIIFFLFVRAFEEKCPTLTVSSFLYAYGPIFCSFVQQLELHYGRSKHTRNVRTSSKTENKIDVQNLENI